MGNWVALIALGLAVLVVGLDITILNVALPTLAADLGADTSQLQWIVNAYVLTLAGAMLPAGVLGDRLGRKSMLLAGLAIFLLGSVGSALSDSTNLLIAMRVVMGIGAAIIIPIVLAIIPLLFDDQDRPKAVGAITASLGIGLPLGLIVGGYLLNHFAWQSIFWINAPIIPIAVVAVVALIPESRALDRPKLDVVGAVIAVLGIVALVYGFIEAPRAGWTSATTIGLVSAGIVLLIGFVMWQTRTGEPLVDLGLFRGAQFAGGTIAMVLSSFVLFGLLFTLPQYLQAVRGNDALGTGLRLIPMMAGLMVSAGASKRLLTKIGAARGTVAGMLISAAALAVLSGVSVDTDMVWIGIGLTFFGLGAGMALTSAMDAVLSSLPRESAGAGSGVVMTLRQIGGALGVAILGSILLSEYQDGLDAEMLQPLPPQSAGVVRDSVVGATQVADQLGPAGQEINRMAGTSYTEAMSVVLLVCAAVGAGAAIVSGMVLRGRPAPAIGERLPAATTQES